MAKCCDGVILAAGLSRRAGSFKMALPLGQSTVIQQAVEGMAGAVEHIYVVVGWQAEQVQALLEPYPQVTLVPNDWFREGMFSSVRAGIAHVGAQRFFLLPGDHPLVSPFTYRQMVVTTGEIVIPVYEGRKGHPVLIDSVLIPDILRQPPDYNLRDYIEARGYRAVGVQDQGILVDVDTPEDYERAQSMKG